MTKREIAKLKHEAAITTLMASGVPGYAAREKAGQLFPLPPLKLREVVLGDRAFRFNPKIDRLETKSLGEGGSNFVAVSPAGVSAEMIVIWTGLVAQPFKPDEECE